MAWKTTCLMLQANKKPIPNAMWLSTLKKPLNSTYQPLKGRAYDEWRIEKGIIVLGYAGFTLFICLIAISIANFLNK